MSSSAADQHPSEPYLTAEVVPEPAPVADPATLAAPAATLAGDAVAAPPPRRGLLVRAVWAAGSALEWVFGVLTLVGLLAVLATFPLLQLASLGYLLEVSGRMARSGRVTAGFVGVRKAARIGSLVVGTVVWLAPLWVIASLVASARLIDPGGLADRIWSIVLLGATAAVGWHVFSAWLRGGRLRSFFWPAPLVPLTTFFRPRQFVAARDATWEFLVGLRPGYYLWLGLRGFLGGLVWLGPPVTLILAGRKAGVLAFVGSLWLSAVLLYLPFVQTHFAATNRFRSYFAVGEVRRVFRRGPWAFWIALVATLALAVPLYLFKIEILPREAAWLPSLVFVLFIWPSRFITGWAYAYAVRRERNRWWINRQLARLAMLPIIAIYVLIVYLTQYTSWYGAYSLYEQHAFLMPVPFLGL